MIELILKRLNFTDTSAIGGLWLGDKRICYTLEDTVREVDGKPVEDWKLKGFTAIPRGSYELAWTRSTRFKRDMLLLKDVPGFSGIRIHSGNWARDTEGCLLVGTSAGKNIIYHSKDALLLLEDLVVPLIHSSEKVMLTIQ